MTNSSRDSSEKTQSPPDSWSFQTIEQVCEPPQYGYTQSATEDPIGPKFVRITDITSGSIDWDKVPYCECSESEISRYLLSPGEILFARTGSTGYSFLIDDCPKAVFASYLIRLKPKESVSRRFLKHFFTSSQYWQQIGQLMVGSVQTGLNATVLKSIKLLLPPISEQRCIAEILDTVDRTITQTKRLIEKLMGIKSGLLHDLLTRGIGEDGRVRNPEENPEEFKDTESGRIPIHWRIVQLAEVAEIVMGQSPPGNTYNSRGIGVPLINGPAEYGERFPTKAHWTTAPTKMCRPGDILLCVRGSTTGRINISNDSYCIGRGVAAVRGITDISLTPYLELFLIRLGAQILSEAKGSGSTFPSITSPRLVKTKLLLPKLSEQERIVETLMTLNSNLVSETHYIEKLRKLKRGLMHDLLIGRVRLKIQKGEKGAS